jgi:hypothetical protein
VAAVSSPDPAALVAVTFTIPAGQVEFVASPGEFQRAERFGPLGSFTSAQTLPVGDGRRELRVFTLPPSVTLRAVNRVPGFNIQILTAGTEIMVRVACSVLESPTDGSDADVDTR